MLDIVVKWHMDLLAVAALMMLSGVKVVLRQLVTLPEPLRALGPGARRRKRGQAHVTRIA
jgi:hypothetical protein